MPLENIEDHSSITPNEPHDEVVYKTNEVMEEEWTE